MHVSSSSILSIDDCNMTMPLHACTDPYMTHADAGVCVSVCACFFRKHITLIHTCIMHTHRHTHTHVHTHTHNNNSYTQIHANTHTHTHTLSVSLSLSLSLSLALSLALSLSRALSLALSLSLARALSLSGAATRHTRECDKGLVKRGACNAGGDQATIGNGVPTCYHPRCVCGLCACVSVCLCV
jgi:hypothetical protein